LQVYDWQAIVNEHGRAVWQTAYRLLGNRSDTADCFQETFLGALQVSRHQPVHSISGLLVRLATARAIDRLRQRARQERYQGCGPDPICSGRAPCDPADQAEVRELSERLRAAIGQLPQQEAKAFCLRYFSELSYREVARELNVRTNAAGVLLHRAKAKLREALNAEHTEIDEVSK
jgi:RNA polymerase sigma-70 factor, ECF subfamily